LKQECCAHKYTHKKQIDTQTFFSPLVLLKKYILKVIGGFFSWKLIHLEGLIFWKMLEKATWMRMSTLVSRPGCNRHHQDDITVFTSGFQEKPSFSVVTGRGCASQKSPPKVTSKSHLKTEAILRRSLNMM